MGEVEGVDAARARAVLPPPIYRSSWFGRRRAAERRAGRAQGASYLADPSCEDHPTELTGPKPGPSPPLPAAGWRHRSAAGGRVRVWWCRDSAKDAATASTIAAAATTSCPKVRALRGREPLADTGL